MNIIYGHICIEWALISRGHVINEMGFKMVAKL